MTKRLKYLAPFLFVIFLSFFLWKGLSLNPQAVFPKETFLPSSAEIDDPIRNENDFHNSEETNSVLNNFTIQDQNQNRNKAQNQYLFKNQNQERLFNNLIHELRCTVCQNQNLAESQADAAVKIRGLIYQQILAAKSKQEILDALVNRYGEFILYKPGFHSKTIILWLGPVLILFFALLIVYRIFFRRLST